MTTSKRTARRIVPRLHKVAVARGLIKSKTVNLDLGGGPYSEASQFLYQHDVTNIVIDPHNRSDEHNKAGANRIELAGADTCTLANVLNVIPSWETRQQILTRAWSLLKDDGLLLVSVYEGDRTGEGRETRDGWQENRKLKTYIDEILETGLFTNVEMSWGILWTRGE